MPARSSKVPGKIGALPIIETSGNEGTFKAAAALLMPLATKANQIADRAAAEKAQSEGVVAGDSGNFVQRSNNRISGRAFNQAADIALKGRLSADFRTALLQAENDFPDNPTKFNERVGGFLVGQMDESGESSPNVALLHKQSTGPSITAAMNRIQTRHERKVDLASLGAMGQYEETMLREGTIIARGMTDGSPNAWANGEDWLLHNYLDASTQWSQLAASGGTLLTPAQRTAKHIAFGQEFADNLLRGMGTNAVDATQFRNDMASGNIKIPMVVEDGGKPEVVQVDPYTILPRTKVDAILRHVDAEILRREREQKGVNARTKFNARQMAEAEIYKAGVNGDGELLPFEILSEVLGESAALGLQDRFDAALDENLMRNTAIGQSSSGRDATQVQLDTLAQSESGDVTAIRKAEAFRMASGRINAALELDGFAAVGEMDSFVQSKREAAVEIQTPEAFQEYIQASKEAQIEQGIFPSRTRVTSNQDIANMVEVLDGAENAIQVREFMNAQVQRYGSHSPQMFAEMVSEGKASELLPILANLPQTGAASALLSGLIAGEVKQTDLDKLVSSDDRKDINESVFDIAEEKLDAYLPPGNTPTRLAQRRAMKLLATQLVSGGKDVDDAVDAAYEVTFGVHYNLDSNSVRVPKTEYDENLGRALKDMDGIVDLVIGDIDASEIFSMDSRLPTDDVREIYLEGLRSHGKLYTNADETGVLIYDQYGNPVVDKDDVPITITWEILRSEGTRKVLGVPQADFKDFFPKTRSRL